MASPQFIEFSSGRHLTHIEIAGENVKCGTAIQGDEFLPVVPKVALGTARPMPDPTGDTTSCRSRDSS
jgi:hypothetical protein